MPGITGIEFARNIPKNTLIIFTTAYTEYALDSYEVDAVDYLVKPIEFERFQKAVNKAINYHALLVTGEKENIEEVENDYLFVKSERRYFKVNFEDILFIGGTERLRDSPTERSTDHYQNDSQGHARTTSCQSVFPH